MTLIPKDTDRFPFGKHKDEYYEDVPASYFFWLEQQDWLKPRWPQVWAYIDHNRAVLELEIEESAE